MENKYMLLNDFTGNFFDLSPQRMLLAGGIVLLLGVVSGRISNVDKTLTRVITAVAIIILIFGVVWLLAQDGPQNTPQNQAAQKSKPENPTLSENKPASPTLKPVLPEPKPEVQASIDFAGRFVNSSGEGIPDAVILLNKHPVGHTNEYGDFSFTLPAQFRKFPFATLECRKSTALGSTTGSTELDLSHSDFNLRLKP